MDTERNYSSPDTSCLSPSLTVRNSHSFTKMVCTCAHVCMNARAWCVCVQGCGGACTWDERRREESKTGQGSLQVQKLQFTFYLYTVESD